MASLFTEVVICVSFIYTEFNLYFQQGV